MALLRSYSFGISNGVDEVPVEVLKLFSSLVENPEKGIKYGSEIVNNGLRGKIALDGSFNLDAYEATIDKHQRLSKSEERKKKVYLDFGDPSDNWDDTYRMGGVNADIATTRAVDQIADAFEEFIDDDELSYAVSTIEELQPVLLVEESVDLLFTMKQALKGIPESVKLIRGICEKYEVVAEQVKVILSSNRSFEQIFPLA